MRFAFLVTTLLLACGGSSKPAPEQPPPPTSSMLDCKQVADHVAETVRAGTPRAGVTPAAVQDMVSTRCSMDYWSDATKHCLFAIKTIAEGRNCKDTMTDDQRSAIKAAAAKLRKDSMAPTDDADPSADWITHVVEAPPAPAPKK